MRQRGKLETGFKVHRGADPDKREEQIKALEQTSLLAEDGIRHEVRLMQVRHLMLRFLQAMMTQMTQTAVCNKHHSIEQQICRWLLLVIERLPASAFAMTHELMSIMLGVRRESVTEAAGHLQRAGLSGMRADKSRF